MLLSSVKTCVRCKIEKPETAFDRWHDRSEGPFRTKCRDCLTAIKEAEQRGNKVCASCCTEKPKTEFSLRGLGPRLRSDCKACAAQDKREHNACPENRAKSYAYTERWKEQNPESVKKTAFGTQLRKYGISREQFDTLLQAQNGVCAICHEEEQAFSRLSVDHVHGTNPPVIRGLLCGKCNKAIGLFKDSSKLLLSTVEYLRKADPLPAGLMPCH